MRTARSLRVTSLLVAATLLTNCGDDTSITAPDGNRPMAAPGVYAAVSTDAAHHPSFPRLYFLPPMVNPAPFEGTFDATLLDHLSVEICRRAGTTCDGDPVATFRSGQGSAALRLDVDEEHYAVHWQVRGPGISTGDYRLNVRLGTVIVGGIDLRLASKPQELKELPPDVVGVLTGRSIPVKFRIEQATDAVVSVQVAPAAADVLLGATQQFTATVIGADGTPRPGEPVTWTSSDPAIATVDASGLATPVTPGTVTITASAAGAAGTATLVVRAPDLRVQALNAPASLVLGNSLALEATITNAGNAPSAATNLRFRILTPDGAEEIAVITQPQDALAPGATVTLTTSVVPDATWPRSFIVEATTDAGAAIVESSETNNDARSPAIPLTAPDLSVTVSASPESVPAGSALAMTATIANSGTSSAAATVVRFRVLDASSNEQIAAIDQPQDAIAAGATATVSATVTALFEWPDNVVVEATTDAGAAVVEWDEANNTARSGSLVVTRPDLTVSAVEVPATLPAGSTLTAKATVRNIGTGPASAAGTRFRFLDAATGAELAATVLPQAALAAGASQEVTASIATLASWPREITVEAMADGGSVVTESSEANNVMTSAAVTLTMADLRVTDVGVPANLPAGGVFNVVAKVANGGNADAASTDIRFRVLDAATGTELAASIVAQPAVAAGGTLDVPASFTSSRDWPRELVVEVTSDVSGAIAELDESNNTARSAAIGLTDPDLVVTSMTFSAASVGLKCSLGVQAVVRNAGSGAAPAANLRFSLRNPAGDVVAFVVVPQPALAAGAEATLNGAFTAGADWPGEVAGIAEADAANTVPESNEANNSGSATATVQARVTVPIGFHKMWICGTGTAWSSGGNWEPFGVPAGNQNVYIPAGVAQYPMLTTTHGVNDLLIEPGATVNTAGQILLATGNVVSASMVGTGYLDMNGAGRQLRGTVPNLVLNGSISLSGDATASSLLVQAGRSLNLNGFTHTVTGDVTVPATAHAAPHLIMTSPTASLVVGRNMTIGGRTQLDAGTIHVRGSFLQNGATNALTPLGTKFIFDGTGPQNVHFSHLRTSWLRDVEIRGPAVNVTNNLSIFGQLDVTPGGIVTQSGGNAYYTLRVPSEVTPGSYRVPTSVIDGNVVMVRDVSLEAGNASIVVDAGHQLNLAGFALTIGGHLSVVGTAADADHILMADGNPRLEVRRDMTVGGRTKLNAGTIVLRGNFLQNGATNSMIPNGTTMVLDGPAKHAVHFSHLGTSWLDDVEVRTKEEVGGVNFTNNLTIRGQLVAYEGALVQQSGGNTYYVNRVPRELAPARYRVPTSVIAGPALLDQDVTLASPVAAIVVDAGHSLAIGEHTLDMAGSFSVVGTASPARHIVMTHADGVMRVGSMTVGGATQLDAGVIHVRGHFLQNGAINALTPGGTKFIFDGAGGQNVHFSHLRSSWLRDVEIRGPAVNFTNNLSIFGQLDVAPGGIVTQTGGNTYYTSRVPSEGTPGSYRVPTSVIDGNAVMVRNIALTSPVASIVVEAGHQLNLAGHELIVGGNFSVAGTAAAADHLLMGSGSPRLEVRGQMTLGGRTKLDAGTVVVRGGFLQNGATNSLTPTGTKFVFEGAASQNVHFSHLWTSWLSDVEIRSHVNFTNNLSVAGQLTVFNGGRLTQTGGNTYYSRRVPDPTTGSFEVPTSVIDGPVVMNRDITWAFPGANLVVDPGHTLDVNGHTLQMAGNFTVAGTAAAAHHLVMPSASSRLIVRDMVVGGRTRLDAGTIQVRGNFLQNGTTDALTTGGTKFIFDGTGPQSVHFSHLRTSWLRDVEIRGPAVNFTNNLSIFGQLDVAAGGVVTQTGGNTYYTLRVPTESTPGSYRVPTSVIDGNAALVRNVTLAATAASIVVEPGHQLHLGGFALTLGGNFTVVGTGSATDHLLMTDAAARLDVGGDVTVGGRTRLDAGTFVMRKSFLQNGATNSMIPTGTLVVFAGSGNLHFSHPGSSWFGHVEVASGASVLTTNSTIMKGNLQLNGSLHTQANTTVQGTFYWAGLLTQNGAMTVGTCSKGSTATFAGAGNNPCP